ncbi:toxin-antitoxin system YwqK family antitoxin [Flammeovirga sp. SubArs3]|uniref:toxin-antitoxin system YwqK family antitoxin n=1 Tax=Flammeovirga sp. SubArs3 TaxID=2995316 RepID=UPI00248B0B2B|nr:toxin-antitoxin system YwqK family antitoxin [Flammeovirga sp. SubArs3]
MEHQVLVLNKYITLFFLIIFFSSCQKGKKEENIVDFKYLPTVHVDSVSHQAMGGIFYVNQQPFSGAIYWSYSNGDTLRVKRYYKGKKEGQWSRYYPDHVMKEKRFFHLGKKEGNHKGFYQNGSLKFHYELSNDVYEGNSKAWTMDGILIRDQNYHLGQEEGPQKVWYDNGKIKANYVIKDGRRYGLLGTKNCINVSDNAI